MEQTTSDRHEDDMKKKISSMSTVKYHRFQLDLLGGSLPILKHTPIRVLLSEGYSRKLATRGIASKPHASP
jgi:hypothetical protein